MSRIARWSVPCTLILFAACHDEPVAPVSEATPLPFAAAAAAPIQLANGGTSSTIFAKAISPDGWILGNFYLTPSGTRAQSWAPYPDLAVDTVSTPGSIYSGTDSHGDLTAHAGSTTGPVVFFADPVTKGHPYTVAPVPTRAGESPGNTMAYAINDGHVVVGWTVGSAALVWLPAGTGTWALPIDLPRPYYPGGYGPFESQAHGINNSGYIVGQVGENINNKPNLIHAVLWRVERTGESWTTTLLGELPKYPQANGHRADDINEAGVIGGVIMTGRGEFPALWFPDAPGVYTRPPTVLSGTADWAVGKLNRCGWLAFTSMGRSTTEAYVWNGSTAVLLPHLPGASGGRGYDVSDQGDVVGMARFTPKNESSYGVAVLWRGAVPACP